MSGGQCFGVRGVAFGGLENFAGERWASEYTGELWKRGCRGEWWAGG